MKKTNRWTKTIHAVRGARHGGVGHADPCKGPGPTHIHAQTRTRASAQTDGGGGGGVREWRSAGVFDYGTLTSRRARMTLGQDETDGPPSSPQGLVLSRYFRHRSYFIFLLAQTDTTTLERNVR